jgi:hypothetical protein
MTLTGDPLGFQPSGKGPQEGRRLVVVFHGWLGTPSKMNDVVQAVRGAYSQEPGLDLYVPPMDYGKFFSSTSAATIVSQLLAAMDVICTDPGRYQQIVLIGALLERQGRAHRHARRIKPWMACIRTA